MNNNDSFYWWILVVLAITLVACTPGTVVQADIYVDLENLQPLPTPLQSGITPLRIAIAAVISPKSTIESYSPLLNYIGEKLERPTELVQRRSYSEINDLIETGEVDLSIVCTSSYLIGKREFGMELLVAPMVNGQTVYHSQLIVPANSDSQELDDLRGKVFAFADPLSFSGRIYPTYMLHLRDETPENFFQTFIFTYSHDESIKAVANGIADGAAVDSLVLRYTLARDPGLADKIRVIHTSPPFGIPPIVIGPGMRPQLRATLLDIFLNMHLTDEGRVVLKMLDIDKFVIVDEELYATAAEVEMEVGSQIHAKDQE